jgi:hypothetical protein
VLYLCLIFRYAYCSIANFQSHTETQLYFRQCKMYVLKVSHFNFEVRRTYSSWMIRYRYEQVYIATVIRSSFQNTFRSVWHLEFQKRRSISFNRFVIVVMGRAVTRAVCRRPVTAKVLVQSQTSPCGICGEQSGTGTRFCTSTSFFPLSVAPVLQTHEFICHRRYIILANIFVKQHTKQVAIFLIHISMLLSGV